MIADGSVDPKIPKILFLPAIANCRLQEFPKKEWGRNIYKLPYQSYPAERFLWKIRCL